MTKKVVCLLFVALFVFAVANFASAQEVMAVAAPCTECAGPCVAGCPVPYAPCCAPAPVIGVRRGFLGAWRPVYAAPYDPCYGPYYPPRFYRPAYRGAYYYGW